MADLGTLDPTGFGVPQPGSLLPPSGFAPAAPTPTPDPGVLGALFPSGQLGGLLDPAQLQALRHQQLLQLGLGLLARSGPRPVGTSSPLTDIAGAAAPVLQNWQQVLGGAAQQAVTLRQLALQQRVLQGRQDIVQQFPPPQGDAATPMAMKQWISSVLPYYIQIGDSETVDHLGSLLRGLNEFGTTNNPYETHVNPDGTVSYISKVPGIPDAGAPVQGSAQDPLHQQATFNGINNGYQAQVAKGQYEQTYRMAQSVLAQVPAAIAGDGAAQFTLLDNFIRFSNPQGVARIGTVQLAREAMPYIQRAQALGQNALTGKSGLLSPQFVRQIAAAVKRGVQPDLQAWRQRYNAALGQVRSSRLDKSYEGNLTAPPDGSDLLVPGETNPRGPASQDANRLLNGGQP